MYCRQTTLHGSAHVSKYIEVSAVKQFGWDLFWQWTWCVLGYCWLCFIIRVLCKCRVWCWFSCRDLQIARRKHVKEFLILYVQLFFVFVLFVLFVSFVCCFKTPLQTCHGKLMEDILGHPCVTDLCGFIHKLTFKVWWSVWWTAVPDMSHEMRCVFVSAHVRVWVTALVVVSAYICDRCNILHISHLRLYPHVHN